MVPLVSCPWPTCSRHAAAPEPVASRAARGRLPRQRALLGCSCTRAKAGSGGAGTPEEQHHKRRVARLHATGTSRHTLKQPAPRLAEFLGSTAGHATCLALDTWRWELLPNGMYRCYAEPYKLLSYDVEPALDLGVTVAPQRCTIQLATARLLGSEAVQQQSQRFTATASHVITWQPACETLDSLVELNVELELFGRGPLALLPTAAMEGPGSALLRRIIRKSLTPFLETLERDYLAWEQRLQGAGEQSIGDN